MAIPINIIFMWPSTNDSIPANWSRVTDLDSRYILGTAENVDPNVTGGNATHSHVADDHTHTQNAHLHSVSGGATSGGENAPLGFVYFASTTHTHSAGNSSNATAVNQNTTVTVNTAFNDPPYFEVIFIKSNGTTDIPNNSLALFDTATPTGWTEYTSTKGKWLKGAITSGDAGGIGGSLDSHTHTTVAHTHVQNAHVHTAFNSGVNVGRVQAGSDGSSGLGAKHTHTHALSFNSNTATNQDTTATIQNSDGRPPYYKLLCAQNTSGSSIITDGVIGLWLGTLATIPTNWAEYIAMRNNFLEVANGSAQIGTTGGSDQHAHTSDSHTHVQNAHNHTVTQSASYPDLDLNGDHDTIVQHRDHNHTWTVVNTTAVNQSTIITINNNTSKANYPLYRTVAFIKYTAPIISGIKLPDSFSRFRRKIIRR